MWLGRGWRIRRSGRSIYLVCGTFRDHNSILIRRMGSTKMTGSFCHMSACLEVERRTSIHSPSLTLPRATRRPSLWPQKRLERLLRLCLASSDGARWSGQTPAGRSRARVHGRGQTAPRKPRCRGQARSCDHPPGPGDRGAIQPDLRWAARWAPVFTGDVAPF